MPKNYAPASIKLMAHGIGLVDVAREKGCTRAAVGFELQGRRPITQTTLDAIAKLTGNDYGFVAEVERLATEAHAKRFPHLHEEVS